LPKTDRRSFLAKSAAAAAATATAGAVSGSAATPKAQTKRTIWANGKAPDKPAMFPPAVAYNNLVFVSGVGAHVGNDIKEHTKIVLDQIQKNLELAGSSMEKCLKATVFLADINDYKAMNEVYLGRFGAEPPVRTTVAVAMLPGKSRVEIDVIAYI
jgi:enamine deaminase RidA (YjgF/YER057c/UK114 family)